MPEYSAPTYRLPNLTREHRSTTPNLVEHRQLRVWAFSRWRGARALAEFFLSSGFRHLPRGGPPMYRLEEFYDGALVVGYYVTFTNLHDAVCLRYKAFWYGCEYLAFTDFSVFTNFNDIFRYRDTIHGLPYEDDEDDE